ncbi:hypothetical protein A9K55_002515 [Cordyceps militaris]|uniref:Pentatricopeptide repeat domain-containing protein n=1 Tax=Cordyceps militaris TaxID=73501 RepID=A0A2H4S8S9_CORMI|nr:hypothetical protein A9K55_002515 [Cordyceps militaris]
MFASAAIIDSIRKDERRKELDKQLEEAKQELAELKEQGKLLPSLHGTNPAGFTPKQMDILWKAMKQIYNERPYRKNVHFPATVAASSVTDCLRKEYYDCPSQSMLQKGQCIDYTALELAISNESEHCSAPGARTETHLRHETSRFLRLVNALLEEADRMDRTNKESRSFTQATELLRSNHAGYTFRSLDPEGARNMTQKLNESLRKILAASMPPKEKIGRICYNMMISSHVPDIHTYNTLISGFDQHGLSALSDHVIYSFFYGRYIRPTQSTFVAILNHNKLMNTPGPFLLNVARITGLDAKAGAKMRRRHQDSLQRNFEQAWAMTNRASKTQTGEFIMEHLPLNQEVVEEMMRGLLRFRLLEQAALLFVGCLKSGVAIGSKVIRQLLDECVSALDWSASVQLIRGMSSYGQQWRFIMVESYEDGLHLVNRVHQLLDLCGIGPRGRELSLSARRLRISEDGLSGLINTLNSTGILLEAKSFLHNFDSSKSRMLQLESLWKEYVKVRKVTASIESKLLNADHSQEFREDCAIHIGSQALQRSEQLSQEFRKLMPSREQPTEEKATVKRPVQTAEKPRICFSQRIAAAQGVAFDGELPMHWNRQLVARPHPMTEHVGLGTA